MVKFLTIRQTAATLLISEDYIRKLVKENRCPGLYSGNRFLVNVDALSEQLDADSRNSVVIVNAPTD